ncbi:unnamed protein product [Urochloa humidicola]
MSHSQRDPAATSALQTGWVQMTNVPTRALNVEAVTLIAELAGDVVAVDEVSLIKEGPVRVKLMGRDISSIRGILEIFVDGVGYDIKFTPESPKEKQQPKGPPPHPGRKDDEADKEGEEGDDSDSDIPRKRGGSEDGKSQRIRDRGSERRSGGTKQCQANNESHKNLGKGTVHEEAKETMQLQWYTEAVPIASYNPDTEEMTILAQKEGNAKIGPAEPDATPTRHYLVHDEGGSSKYIEKSKWPKLLTKEELENKREETKPTHSESKTREALHEGVEGEADMGLTEDDIEEQLFEEDDAIGGDQLETPEKWERTRMSNQKKGKRKFYPAIAARKSSRRGLATSNTFNNQGMINTNANPFTVLNSCNNETLEEIAISCDVILGENKEEIEEVLCAMKLEELVRAGIAEAQHKQNLGERLDDLHVLEGECLDLQIIDNSNRGGLEEELTQQMHQEEAEENVTKQTQESDRGRTKTKGGKKAGKGGEKGSRLSWELRRISYQ